MLLRGDVRVRRGLLMLEPANVTVVGGSVAVLEQQRQEVLRAAARAAARHEIDRVAEEVDQQ